MLSENNNAKRLEIGKITDKLETGLNFCRSEDKHIFMHYNARKYVINDCFDTGILKSSKSTNPG